MDNDLGELPLNRMLAGWHLRLEADLRQINASLDAVGAQPEVLEKPDFLSGGEVLEARARVLVRPGTVKPASELLLKDGWRPLGAGGKHRTVMTREGVLIELTDSRTRSPHRYAGLAERMSQLRDGVLGWLGLLRAPRYTFDGLELHASRGVYAPAEYGVSLVHAVLGELKRVEAPVIVDVGTGSGAIALALATRRPDATVFGTDFSTRAVNAARRNARRLGVRNVRIHRGSLLDGMPLHWRGQVHALVANLPYVPPLYRSYYTLTGPGWRGPDSAIQGPDADGLGLVRRLVAAAPDWLTADGVLVLEIGNWQIPRLARDLERGGLEIIRHEPGMAVARRRLPVGAV